MSYHLPDNGNAILLDRGQESGIWLFIGDQSIDFIPGIEKEYASGIEFGMVCQQIIVLGVLHHDPADLGAGSTVVEHAIGRDIAAGSESGVYIDLLAEIHGGYIVHGSHFPIQKASDDEGVDPGLRLEQVQGKNTVGKYGHGSVGRQDL